MKIVLAVPEIQHGGGIGATSRLLTVAAAELAGADATEVLVLHGQSSNIVPAGVRQRLCGGSGAWLALRLLAKTVLRRDVVLVASHVHLLRPLLLLPRGWWPTTVVIAHGSESTHKIRPASRRCFERAALTLTNSKYTANRMRKLGIRGNIKPLELGLSVDMGEDISTAQAATNQMPELVTAAGGSRRPGSRALLLVGRMLKSEREKGHDELIDVLPQLLHAQPQTELVFVGDGDLRGDLAERARELGVADKVFLPGFLPTRTLKDVYAAAYAYVMPSRQEGFGLVYLEAMQQAKACVACADDGGGEVVVDGETGWHVQNPADLDELCRVLVDVLTRPEEAARRGARGLGRLKSHYTRRHVIERFKAHVAGLGAAH